MTWINGPCLPGEQERVSLTRREWRSVFAALDGDETQRENAYDALIRQRPGGVAG